MQCWFVCLCVFGLFLFGAVHANSELPLSIKPFTSSSYEASWGLSADNSTLMVEIVLEDWAWVGIGWQPFGSDISFPMTSADFVVSVFGSDGTVTTTDRYCACENGGQEPSLDTDIGGSDNILSYSGLQFVNSNGTKVTQVQFSRKLVTGDTVGDNDIKPGLMTVLFAFGVSNDFNDGHGNNAVSQQLDFFSETAPIVQTDSNATNLKYWHGCCMTVAFGFCMSLGVFFPRYMKSFWWWFPVHICIQITGVILALVGFVVIMVASEGSHFTSVHSWFGLVTIGIALATPLLGTMAHFMWNSARSRIPIFPDQLHWWSGRATIILSWVTIFLGMALLGIPVEIITAFAFVLLAYIVAYTWLDIMKIKEIGLKAYLFGAYTSQETKEPVLSEYY